MRIVSVTFPGFDDTGFKALAANVPIAPAVVLFGPNDAGKSNLLEGLSLALSGGGMNDRGPLEEELVPEGVVATVHIEPPLSMMTNHPTAGY